MSTLTDQMERAGWRLLRQLDPAENLRGDGVEAFGEDATGDVSIHVDASHQGQVRGYEVFRRDSRDVLDASGRIPAASVPTPEQAMGRWEEQMAGEAKRGLR